MVPALERLVQEARCVTEETETRRQQVSEP